MPKKFPPEVRERAVRMTLDRLPDYPSVSAAATAIAPKLNVGVETLRKWVVQAQIDAGAKAAVEVDITDRVQVKKAVATFIDRFGRLDILINNAGLMLLGPDTGAGCESLTVHRRLATAGQCPGGKLPCRPTSAVRT